MKKTFLRKEKKELSSFSKLFTCMKLSIVFFFLATFCLSANNMFSQSARVNLHYQNGKVVDILSDIEKQTEYLFFYNKEAIDADREVDIVAENQPVSEVLNNLFDELNIGYKLIDNHIVLSPSLAKKLTPQDTPQTDRRKLIYGTIVDEMGEPVIGASVVVKGTQRGTSTDVNGRFEIELEANENLAITYLGYKSQEISWKGESPLNITLREDTQLLDEVVVVGFGVQKKVNLTGSVSVIGAEELQSRPVSNVSQALQGLVPGMNFSYASGGTGGDIGDEMSINIRGAGTIGDGSSASPLILIDGMEGNMNMLNPQDIESISILKDAAASSIYGSRAPFGVVLITTKKGAVGKVSINYNNSFRWSEAINLPNVADAYTYANYFNKMQINDGATAVQFDNERLQAIKDYADGKITSTTKPNRQTPTIWDWIGNTNTDWYDVVFGGVAFSQEHSLSVNGGTEKFQYYFSANYLNQNGMVAIRRDNLERYAVTGKINAQLFDWLKISYNTKYMRKDYTKPTALTDKVLYQNIAKRWPMEPTTDPNGYSMSNTILNPILYGGDSDTQTDWLYQQFQLIAEPIKNWKIFGELNYKVVDAFSHIDYLKSPMHDVSGNIYYGDTWNTTKVTEGSERTNYFNSNIYSEYDLSIHETHNIKVMAGFQAEVNKWRKLQASALDLISESVPNINAATGKTNIDVSRLTHWATAGFFGRLNYNFKERYLFEMNLRYDGTSRFAKDKRWNLFPSFSAGWNIAREGFMEPYLKTINNLKIRGSWGELGNQNTTSLYPYIQLMNFIAEDPNSHWLVNGERPNTANAPNLISSLLGWETMRSWNIGFDIGMLNNRLNLSFDWFNRKTINMVGPAPELPVTLGAAVPKVNNADMQSSGFEIDLSWKDYIKDFNYSVRFLLSDDRQKILKYPNITGNLNTWREGQYIGEIWGLETVGIAKSQEEMDQHLSSLAQGGQDAIGSKWGAGDIMYKDIDGDGRITEGATIYEPGDKRVIGNSSPRFKVGLDLTSAWKGFDIRVFFQGVAKRDAWLNDNMFWGSTGGIWQSACFTSHLDFFRPEGDDWGANLDAYFPRTLVDNYAKNQKTQTRYLQNAAYLRLKNLQIGYTIPKHITQKIGISNMRVFFSGENLFTITGLPEGFDPETINTGYGADWGNSSGKTYPLSRTFSGGFSVNF